MFLDKLLVRATGTPFSAGRPGSAPSESFVQRHSPITPHIAKYDSLLFAGAASIPANGFDLEAGSMDFGFPFPQQPQPAFLLAHSNREASDQDFPARTPARPNAEQSLTPVILN
jgi:hypothetical protein